MENDLHSTHSFTLKEDKDPTEGTRMYTASVAMGMEPRAAPRSRTVHVWSLVGWQQDVTEWEIYSTSEPGSRDACF